MEREERAGVKRSRGRQEYGERLTTALRDREVVGLTTVFWPCLSWVWAWGNHFIFVCFLSSKIIFEKTGSRQRKMRNVVPLLSELESISKPHTVFQCQWCLLQALCKAGSLLALHYHGGWLFKLGKKLPSGQLGHCILAPICCFRIKHVGPRCCVQSERLELGRKEKSAVPVQF